jgi:hypothetical protein
MTESTNGKICLVVTFFVFVLNLHFLLPHLITFIDLFDLKYKRFDGKVYHEKIDKQTISLKVRLLF